MVSSVSKMTPKDARVKKMNMNISLQAKSNREYPKIEVGDRVKVMRKKTIAEKERTSNYLKEEFGVQKLEKGLRQNYYYLKGRPRSHLRFEILKV